MFLETESKSEEGEELSKRGPNLRSKPDLSLIWEENLNITFRITKDKRVNSDIQYKLFPNFEDLRKVPCADSIKFKSNQKSKSSTLSSYLGRTNSPEKKVAKKCNICGKIFNKLNHLKKHIRNHGKEKPHKCPTCKMGFYQESNLQKHLVSHEAKIPEVSTPQPSRKSVASPKKESPIKIKIVSPTAAPVTPQPKPKHLSTSAKLSPLTAGVRAVQVRPGQPAPVARYRCQMCDKIFLTVATLQQHIMQHVGHKPFRCGLCPARFLQQGSYNVHMAMVHNKIGHPCPHCHISFRAIQDVQLHIKSMHIRPLPTSDVFEFK